jgi:hypothetical protein
MMDPSDSRSKPAINGWNPVFSQRREAIYSREANLAIYDEFGASSSLTTQETITRFLNYRCDGNAERYLYRNLQISNFLKGLDVECLLQGSFSDVTSPLVLMDDRNNASSSSDNLGGNYRLSKGPLNAHQFYRELRKNVCLSTFSNF